MSILADFHNLLEALSKQNKSSERQNACVEMSTQSVLADLHISITYIAEQGLVDEAVTHLLQCTCLLGLDIETAPLPDYKKDKQAGLVPRKSRIRLVQIFDGCSRVFVFDLFKLPFSVLEPLKNKPFVAHNALFELQHLTYAGLLLSRVGCSLLADRVLNGKRLELDPALGLSKKATLKALSQELLGLEISKEQQKSDWALQNLTEEQLAYAALDAVLACKIFERQYILLKELHLVNAYTLLRDAQQPIVNMMLAGIQFDVKAHKALITAWKEEALSLEHTLLEEFGSVLNLRSGKQLNAWLTANLSEVDLKTWPRTAKGSLSTSTPTFKNNLGLQKAFPKMVRYRHLATRLSSFGEKLYRFIDERSGRLFGGFTLGTTATGRLSSVKPNLQNLPRGDYRKLFIAKRGYSLLCLDYGQQELRIAALLSQDKAFLKVFEKGLDIHKQTAAALLHIPEARVSKDDRQLAKAVNFGLLYGQGAEGLVAYAKNSYGVVMTVQEAEKHRRTFFSVYKGLRKWQYDTSSRAKLMERAVTKGGFIRDFSKMARGFRFTVSLNHPVQGAGAEVMLNALKRVSNFVCVDCRLVNSVHDELLFEVRDEKASYYLKLAEEEMLKAFLDVFPKSESYLKGFIEGHVGGNWLEAK